MQCADIQSAKKGNGVSTLLLGSFLSILLICKWKTKEDEESVDQFSFPCWPQLTLICSARSEEAEEVGPARTERDFARNCLLGL